MVVKLSKKVVIQTECCRTDYGGEFCRQNDTGCLFWGLIGQGSFFNTILATCVSGRLSSYWFNICKFWGFYSGIDVSIFWHKALHEWTICSRRFVTSYWSQLPKVSLWDHYFSKCRELISDWHGTTSDKNEAWFSISVSRLIVTFSVSNKLYSYGYDSGWARWIKNVLWRKLFWSILILYISWQIIWRSSGLKAFLFHLLDQAHVKQKREELGLRYKKMYWLIGRISSLSLHNKLLLYKQILKPVWT
jgi:hypothetical protein